MASIRSNCLHPSPADPTTRIVMASRSARRRPSSFCSVRPTASMPMQCCVSYSLRFFPGGKVTKPNLKQAELAARLEVQTIAADYRGLWRHALGSSGTAKAISEILELNGYSKGGITRDGLEKLRTQLLKAGDVQKLDLQGLRPDRTPVLAGGFAIMHAAFCEREIG